MKNLMLFVLLPFLIIGCNKSGVKAICDQIGIVDSEQYRDAPRDDFDFVSAEIKGDCLEVTVQYGGGCGDATFLLIGEEKLNQSLPPQRPIVISLDDQDYCKALVTKTISFDLTNLREENYDEVQLILDGLSRTPLLYKY